MPAIPDNVSFFLFALLFFIGWVVFVAGAIFLAYKVILPCDPGLSEHFNSYLARHQRIGRRLLDDVGKQPEHGDISEIDDGEDPRSR